jgi:transposase-like protein
VYRAVDQFGQVIDVFVSRQRDATAAHRFFQRAIGATKVSQVEVTTDQAPVYPAVLEERLPAAWHRTDRFANNRIECDHGRLKARLRPMRGLKQDRSAGWSSPGMHSCRTFGVDTTSWPSRSPPTGDWRSHSKNRSWRSDPE